MTLSDFRAKLGSIMAEVDRDIAAEGGSRTTQSKPKASGNGQRQSAKPKSQPKAATRPKAEKKAAEPEAPAQPKAEPTYVPFRKGFALEATLNPLGLVGKNAPRNKFQAEGLEVGDGEAKVYAYLPEGKDLPDSITAVFDGQSRGKKAAFKAENEDRFAVYIYLPVHATTASLLAVTPTMSEDGNLKVAIAKAAQPKAEKKVKAKAQTS